MPQLLDNAANFSDAVLKLGKIGTATSLVVGAAGKVLRHYFPQIAVPGYIDVVLTTICAVGIVFGAGILVLWCRREWSAYQRLRHWVLEYDPEFAANKPHAEHASLEAKMIAVVAWRAVPLEEKVQAMEKKARATP